MQLRSKIFAALAITTLAVTCPLTATTIQTTSYSAWLATVTGAQEADFTHIGNSSYNDSNGFALSSSLGVFTVTGPYSGGFSLTGNAYSGTQSLYGPINGTGSIHIATPSGGLTGVLMAIGTTGGAPVTIKLSDGESFTANPTTGSFAWFGFSSTQSISSIDLGTSAGSQAVLLDLWGGTSTMSPDPVTPAPEAATALLIGCGLLFLGGRRKVFSTFAVHAAA